jgi:hypothetical protein
LALDKVVADALGMRPVHHAEMNAEFCVGRACVVAEATEVLVTANAVVPEQVPPLHISVAIALTPFRPALVAELSTTHAGDVIAPGALLDDVPTLEATHPVLPPAEPGDRVGFVGEELELEAGKAFVPRRLAGRADRREAPRASDRRPTQRVLHSVVEHNQRAASRDRAEHLVLADFFQYCGLVLLAQQLRQRATHGSVDLVAQLGMLCRAAAQRQERPVREGHPG